MEHITIHLHETNKPTRDITVCKYDPIQVLQSEVTGTEKRLIMFKRFILLTSFSFMYFGIKDGDDLYVIRGSGNRIARSALPRRPQQKHSRAHISLKSGDVEVDRSAILECVRIMDLMYMKDEFRPQALACEARDAQKEQPKEETKMVFNQIQASEPSSEVLPIFWENRRRFLHKI